MPRSVRRLVMLGLVALALIACQDSGVSTGGLIGGKRPANSFIVVVGPGAEPRFSWTGGQAYSVSVVRTSDPTTVIWGIATPDRDGISSGVTHGTVQQGVVPTAQPIDQEVPLADAQLFDCSTEGTRHPRETKGLDDGLTTEEQSCCAPGTCC